MFGGVWNWYVNIEDIVLFDEKNNFFIIFY